MIKINNVEIAGFKTAIRGMRNPKESWDKSDSYGYYFMETDACYLTDLNINVVDSYYEDGWTEQDILDKKYWIEKNSILDKDDEKEVPGYNLFYLGAEDLKLAQKLVLAGTDHSKFMRQIYVGFDLTAPLYLWKEIDTYKVATVANSTSTMHKLADTPINFDCFSFDNFAVKGNKEANEQMLLDLHTIVSICESYRKKYVETCDKAYWRRLIQILPESWMQTRTMTMNYQTLRNIYFARKDHRLTEWHQFCNWIESLPYAKELICLKKGEKQ